MALVLEPNEGVKTPGQNSTAAYDESYASDTLDCETFLRAIESLLDHSFDSANNRARILSSQNAQYASCYYSGRE